MLKFKKQLSQDIGSPSSCNMFCSFTSSNGDPSTNTSLHYRDPSGRPNEYMHAIRIIGDIVAPYDNDRLIPAFGFGGYLKSLNDTSHCFSLTGPGNNPYCNGIDGVLMAYRASFNWLQLSGPTHFAPIINQVASLASKVDAGSKYLILLMITDGAINDMSHTINALREAANLPLSIIIVTIHKWKKIDHTIKIVL